MEYNYEALTFRIGIDNYGFGIGGSREEMIEDDRVDSVDVILRVISGNNIMINDFIN